VNLFWLSKFYFFLSLFSIIFIFIMIIIHNSTNEDLLNVQSIFEFDNIIRSNSFEFKYIALPKLKVTNVFMCIKIDFQESVIMLIHYSKNRKIIAVFYN